MTAFEIWWAAEGHALVEHYDIRTIAWKAWIAAQSASIRQMKDHGLTEKGEQE